jgi:hypothetical protein
MLTNIPIDFRNSTDVRKALTAFRKHYHVALRGAVTGSVSHPSGNRVIGRVWVELGNTGFSRAEFANALRQFVPAE